MVVGAVELAARKRPLEPSEQCFVPDVHAECDLGLTTVTSEVPFPHQQADENSLFEIAGHESASTVRRMGCWGVSP